MFENLGSDPLEVQLTVTDAARRAPARDRLRSRVFMGVHRDLPLLVLGIRWQACRLAFAAAPRRGRLRSLVMRTWKSVNEALSQREQLARRTRLRSLPPHLIVDSTVRCNLHCRLCVRQTQPEALDLRHDLPRELLERVVATLFPTARSVNLSLIGEPLLTPHLDYLLDAMAAHGVGLNLITNGTLLGGPAVRDRVVPLLHSLEVSLDSTDPALSTRLRGGGDHALVLANLRAIAAVRRALPGPAFSFGLSVTLTSLNLEELPKLIALAAELGCSHVRGCFSVIFRGSDRELSVLNVPERYNEISVIARERAQALAVPLSIPGPIEDCTGQSAERDVCPFLYSIGFVDHRGRLASCLHHQPPFAEAFGAGSIRSFRNRAQLRRLRRDHDTVRAHGSCRDCFIILRGPTSIADRRRQFLP